jgi:polysaccharide biosynthesis transport protein
MVDQQEYFEDDGLDLGELLRGLWRRRVFISLTTTAVFAVGVVIILAWPTTYQSTATILLEEPEVPRTLMQTTVTTFAAEQIQYINQRVMTRTNLAGIIEKFDLYKEKRRYTPTLLLTDIVRENMLLDLINVEMTDPNRGMPMMKALAFVVGFKDEDPETAQRVTNEVVSLYMVENVRSRTVQTVETREFLGEEVNILDRKVKELEEQMARFKEENDTNLPEMTRINMTNIERIDRQLMDLSNRIDGLDESRIIIDSQLAQTEPTRPLILPDGSAAMSATDQLKSMQTKLARLKGMYGADHPDISRTKREIVALQAETGLTSDLTEVTGLLNNARTDLAKARENYGSDHPEVVRLERLVDSLVESVKTQRKDADSLIEPDNPVYIQLVAQKDSIDAQERAFLSQQKELFAQLSEYEDRMLKAPAVEQQLVAMQRELQSSTGRYYAMRDRQFAAEMGEALETQSKGERFVLVEPANLPLEPASPNRPALLILLLFLSPAAGVGYVILRRMMDKSIWGAKMLDSVQGTPAIAEIPIILTQAEKRHTRRVRIFTVAGAPVALALLAVTIHYAMRPLDVIWFVVLRKLGI